MDRLLSEQELLKHFDPREDWVVVQTIKAIPSVEPCDDAISREWLKTAIHNFYYGLKHIPTEEDIQAYIDVAPSVKPQEPQWIPVSERLPEDRMACLLYGKMHFVPDHVDEKNWFYDYSIGCFNSAFGWSIRGDMEVLAWMPLPKPYEPQERSE